MVNAEKTFLEFVLKKHDWKFHDADKALRKALLMMLLDKCDWNVNEVARLCGVDRSHIYRMIRQNGIKEPDQPLISVAPDSITALILAWPAPKATNTHQDINHLGRQRIKNAR